MHGIMTLLRDDHYRATIATWTRDLRTFTGCLMDKTGEKQQSKFWCDIAMVFKGLNIHIARFHSQSRTGGGAYLQDKNTFAGTLGEMGGGLIRERGHIRGILRYNLWWNVPGCKHGCKHPLACWRAEATWALAISDCKDLVWALIQEWVLSIHEAKTSTWALTQEWALAQDTTVHVLCFFWVLIDNIPWCMLNNCNLATDKRTFWTNR